MAVNELKVWAECNDGHTTLAGLNVDEFTVGEICKWTGIIRLVFTKDSGERVMTGCDYCNNLVPARQ